MRSRPPGPRPGLPIGLLLIGLLPTLTSGCGPKPPFEIVPISGKVTYDVGTPIGGPRVVLTFHPQVAAVDPKASPRAGTTDLKPDGSFGEVTTWKFGDGVVVGPQKVTIVSVDKKMQFSGAVDPIYSNVKTTPLTAEIKRGEHEFKLTIPQPPTYRKP